MHDTVKLHDIDVVPPRYVLDTLALGPKNAVQDQFNPHNVLADLDILLRNCKRNKVNRQCINDLNIMVVKYIKICSKQRLPRNLKLTQKFLKNHDLLAVPFDKGNGFCVMKAAAYESKLQKILDLPQFEKVVSTRKNEKDCVIKEEERIMKILKVDSHPETDWESTTTFIWPGKGSQGRHSSASSAVNAGIPIPQGCTTGC